MSLELAMTYDTARKLLLSTDRARVAAGGREIGGLLATQAPAALPALRREIDQVSRAATDEFHRGFTAACEMVVTGFARERERTDQVAADLDLVRSRRHWLETLEAIDQEVVRPRAIAQRLGAPESSVSKVLEALEEAGFIERADTAADRRGRPRRLTLRARLALRHAEPEATAPVRSVVAAVVDCMATLADRHRDSRHALEQRLARTLGPALAPTALAALLDALADCALGQLDPDDAVVATGLELQRQLEAALHGALRDDLALPRLAALAGELPLLVRATRDEWDLLVDRRAWPNVHVVRNDDLAHTALPAAYQVLYESPLLAVDDVRQQRPVLEGASRRWVVTPGPDRDPPAGFESIDIHALFAADA